MEESKKHERPSRTSHPISVCRNSNFYYPYTTQQPSSSPPRSHSTLVSMSTTSHHPRSFVSVTRPEWDNDKSSIASRYGIIEDTVIVKQSNSDIGETSTDEDGDDDDPISKLDGCARKQNRFNNTQDKILVGKWVALAKELQSGDSRKYWKVIQEEVNRAGSHKSVTQIKKKILALKKRYKDVKLHNKSGRPRMTCKFYEELDSVLGGSMDTVIIPPVMASVLSSGKPAERIENEESTAEYLETRLPEETEYDNTYIRRDENNHVHREEESEREYRNRRKRGKFDAAVAINETIIEMQERQERFMERFFNKMAEMEERAEERSNQFLLKVIEAIKK